MIGLKLDDRDLKILSILSREGRLPKADLAKRVNLSPTPLWERLKRLERAGVIRGYSADISLKSVASHIEVFVTIELESHRAESFQTFERTINLYDEIVACWAVGGGFDYVLQVVTKDIDSYQRLIDTLLDGGIGLARYYTYVVTKPVKLRGAPPLKFLVGDPAEDEAAASASE
ncbi:Lrp/AsnC family transcriptional regulator [uncultured Roseibium sp.]|uniref:Lrp/AsnC family transcriptional regulator n=1 Tax=uncultured Roseibium sp. TaxID=1936171 RepID=UPI0026211D4A|nr:Lrp/AsnC family transcriptional regulator [uncultured Roseibium sp.]